MAEHISSFDSASFFDSASYFGTLFGFDSVSYRHRKRKNSFVFLFSSPSSTEWHMIRFFFSRLILEVLTLMVIFRALKDKRRVLVLRKGYNI